MFSPSPWENTNTLLLNLGPHGNEMRCYIKRESKQTSSVYPVVHRKGVQNGSHSNRTNYIYVTNIFCCVAIAISWRKYIHAPHYAILLYSMLARMFSSGNREHHAGWGYKSRYTHLGFADEGRFAVQHTHNAHIVDLSRHKFT